MALKKEQYWLWVIVCSSPPIINRIPLFHNQNIQNQNQNTGVWFAISLWPTSMKTTYRNILRITLRYLINTSHTPDIYITTCFYSFMAHKFLSPSIKTNPSKVSLKCFLSAQCCYSFTLYNIILNTINFTNDLPPYIVLFLHKLCNIRICDNKGSQYKWGI